MDSKVASDFKACPGTIPVFPCYSSSLVTRSFLWYPFLDLASSTLFLTTLVSSSVLSPNHASPYVYVDPVKVVKKGKCAEPSRSLCIDFATYNTSSVALDKP